MELTITNSAVQFYKNEMNLKNGDTVTLFVRVGGVGSGGFSAGIVIGTPVVPYFNYDKSGISFCVTEEDVWYFNDMTIDYNKDMEEVVFQNPKIGDVVNPNDM
ncbi:MULTISPECIES: iron-sulfur cluster biosynthesis family protein [Bacillaceae]|uniref:Core domain-containing protein n=1 Tax=Evansella alkalicola TaxID=745819 RepID=A0ABS6JTL5_9BACI|nr:MULTISPECIES: iron-sulfur cluster biosynthesis family protein [Bacillaceae]MBU9721426.1 hypothetical protein [Bacillus alkalicola]